MTKNEELQALRDLVTRLGANSYVGPWLADQIPAIEKDIRSDMLPQVSYSETKQHAADTIAAAEMRAKEITDAAREESMRIMDQTQRAKINVVSRFESLCREFKVKSGVSSVL
jgi:hypothetical protein